MPKRPFLLLAAVVALAGCSQSKQTTAHQKALHLPPEVTGNPNAKEVARIWITGETQTVILAPNSEWGPDEWGIMLVDLARHVANAEHLRSGTDKDQTLARIKKMFDAEWDDPTDQPRGQLGR